MSRGGRLGLDHTAGSAKDRIQWLIDALDRDITLFNSSPGLATTLIPLPSCR